MSVNTHLFSYLDEFEATDDPGFAVMVTAPWGAGKSHAIKGYLKDKEHLYVSLYGVQSRDDIDRAILIQRLPMIGKDWTKGLGSIGGAALKYLKIDIKPDAFAKLSLPDLLVFDDLERALLPPTDLLGYLNEFVEHQRQKVILLTNEDEFQDGDKYRRQKEKMVGRTLSLEPDFQTAFDAFVEQVDQQDARDLFGRHVERIREVFDASQYQNLRLLRQALLEFARFFDAFDEGMRQRSRAVEELLRLYLALHIEFGKGALTKADLRRRGWWSPLSRKKIETDPLETAREKYDDLGMQIAEDRIFPSELAVSLLADGYCPAEDIRTQLKATAGFASVEKEDAWKTVWWWSQRSEEAFYRALDSVQSDLQDNNIHSPELLLQITGSFLSLSDAKVITSSRSDVATDIRNVIDRLADEGILAPMHPSERFDPNRLGQESFNGLGFPQRETKEFVEVADYLEHKRKALFRESYGRIAAEILHKIDENFDDGIAMLTYTSASPKLGGYLEIPVLTTLDPARAAQQFCNQDIERIAALFKALAHRVVAQRQSSISDHEQQTEFDWLARFATAVQAIADNETPFRAAQLRRWLDASLREISATE